LHLILVQKGTGEMSESNFAKTIQSMVAKPSTPTSILDKTVRFSISLTNLQNRRLELLVNKINVSKQEFIQRVIEAAMCDVEDELKLIDGGYMNQLGQSVREYKGAYIREIVESLGIKEEEWWDLVDESR
jgi:predicted DNA-binding protein